jgi:hypothetical protein
MISTSTKKRTQSQAEISSTTDGSSSTKSASRKRARRASETPRTRQVGRTPKPADGYVAADVRLLQRGIEALRDGSLHALAGLHAPLVEHLENAARQAKQKLPARRPEVDPTRPGALPPEQLEALRTVTKAILVRVAATLPAGTLVDNEPAPSFAQRLLATEAAADATAPGSPEADYSMPELYPEPSFVEAWATPEPMLVDSQPATPPMMAVAASPSTFIWEPVSRAEAPLVRDFSAAFRSFKVEADGATLDPRGLL